MKHIQPIVEPSERPAYREPVAPRLRKLECVALCIAALLLLAFAIWLTGSATAHLYNK